MQQYDPKEVQEAITATNNTLYYLIEAKKDLGSARNYGIWDMVGGGFFSTMLKHDKMEQAENKLKDAKKSIRQLSKELDDIGKVEELKIEVSEFLSFADYFFDGVVADWMVQSKIKRAAEQVDEAIDKVSFLKERLESMLRNNSSDF